MKKKHLLFGIAVLVAAALLVGFINYATDIPDTDKVTQKTQVKTNVPAETTDTPVVKKKSCTCCADRMARLQEQIRKARERKQRENNIVVRDTASTGNAK